MIYPVSPSQLAPLLANERLRAVIERAAKRYAALVYEHDTESIRYIAGDGMAWHSAFNRGFAEGLERGASRRYWRFEPDADAAARIEGDAVWTERARGQVRFGLRLGGARYSVLHMTGDVDERAQTLDVMALGIARREWLNSQNESVVAVEPPHLFNQDDDGFRMRPHSEEPLNVVIATQRRGAGTLRVWAGVPTGGGDGLGLIALAEVAHLFDVPIQSKTGRGRVHALPDAERAA